MSTTINIKESNGSSLYLYLKFNHSWHK